MRFGRSTSDIQPTGLTPVCIVGYLTFFYLWRALAPINPPFRSISFNVVYIVVVSTILWWSGHGREIKRYLVGRLWPTSSVLVVMFPIALVLWFLLTSMVFPAGTPTEFQTRYIVANIFVGPLVEEPVYRGVFLAILLKNARLARSIAVIFSALIFASIHRISPTWEQLIVFIGGGWLLGWAYLVTGSVPFCALCHALWNSLTFCPWAFNPRL
jgi:membrane protease YdiL (CAAX protease family)